MASTMVAMGIALNAGTEPRENSVDSRVVSLPNRSSHTELLSASEGHILPNLMYRDLRNRKINVQVCEKYGVGFRGEDLVFPYWYSR